MHRTREGDGDGTGTLDTSTEGAHTYAVTATSQDGQVGTARIAYTVVGKSPEVVITAPINNAAYLWTGLPAADFTCIAGAGSTVQSCKATAGGQPISDGQALPNALGTHTVSVTATDADGLSATQTAIYTVTYSAVPPPPVSIEAPAQGASYRLGQAVAARYSCAAGLHRARAAVLRRHRPRGPPHQHGDAGRPPLQRVGHQRSGRVDDRDGELQGGAHDQPLRRPAAARDRLGRGAGGAQAAGARFRPRHRDRVERGGGGLPSAPGLRDGERGRPPGRPAGARRPAHRRRPGAAGNPRRAARDRPGGDYKPPGARARVLRPKPLCLS